MKINKKLQVAAVAFVMILCSMAPLAFADEEYGTVESSILIDSDTPLTSDPTQNVAFDGRRYGIETLSVGDLDSDGVPEVLVANFNRDMENPYGRVQGVVLFMNANGTVREQRELTLDESGLPGGCYYDGLLVSELGLYEKMAYIGPMIEGGDPVVMAVAVDENDKKGALYALSLKYNSDSSVSIVTACSRIAENVGGFNPVPGDNYPDDSVKTYLGYPIANVGDLDDDGFTDIFVGVDNGENEDEDINEGGGTDIYIFYLQQDSEGAVTVKDHSKIASVSADLTTNSIIDSMAMIELDGDRDTLEMVYGAAGIFGTTPDTLFIVSYNQDWSMNWTQTISDDSGDFISGNPGNYFPDSPAYKFGSSMAVLGDIDGDTVPDIAVGAQFDYSDKTELGLSSGGGPGAVYVLFMNRNGTVKSYQKISHLYGNLTDGDPTNEFMTSGSKFGGSSLAVDFNSDGQNELMVGDFDYANPTSGVSGVVYVLDLEIKPSLTNLAGGTLVAESPPANFYHPSGNAYTVTLNFQGYDSMTDIINATNGYISNGDVPLVIIRRGVSDGLTMDIDEVTIPGGATFACAGEKMLSLYYDTDEAKFRDLEWVPTGKCPTQNYINGARNKSPIVLEPNAHINGWNIDASDYTYGIEMSTAGTAYVTNTTVSNANSNGSDGRGIWATGLGTTLYVTDSKVDGSTEDGFRVNGGATMILDNIETTNNKKNGVFVGGRTNGGNLVITNSSSSENKFGIMGANGFTTISVSGSKFFNNDQSAMELYGYSGGGSIIVTGSEIYNNNLISAPLGSVAILGIEQATIRNTTIRDNNNGAVGIYSESDTGYSDPSVATTLDNVTITGNGTDAVVSRGDSTVTITTSTLDGNCSALADRHGGSAVGTITVDGVNAASGPCP